MNYLQVTLKKMHDGWHWSAEIRSTIESMLAFGGGIYDPDVGAYATPEAALLAARQWFTANGETP